MKRLALFSLMVIVTWFGYHKFSANVTPEVDAALLGFIAIVCGECVVVMFAYTLKWRILALGLLAFFLATGLLYLRVSSAGLHHPVIRGDSAIQLVRALYLDAAILVAIGLNRWAWRHRHEAIPWRKNAQSPPPIFFEAERGDLP